MLGFTPCSSSILKIYVSPTLFSSNCIGSKITLPSLSFVAVMFVTILPSSEVSRNVNSLALSVLSPLVSRIFLILTTASAGLKK